MWLYSLPFFHESNTAMGILMKTYLSKTDEPQKNLQSMIEEFPNCLNVLEDLRRAFFFWNEVSQKALFCRFF
jgi:hypothetical protein